jgi:hypothetical protein
MYEFPVPPFPPPPLSPTISVDATASRVRAAAWSLFRYVTATASTALHAAAASTAALGASRTFADAALLEAGDANVPQGSAAEVRRGGGCFLWCCFAVMSPASRCPRVVWMGLTVVCRSVSGPAEPPFHAHLPAPFLIAHKHVGARRFVWVRVHVCALVVSVPGGGPGQARRRGGG